MLSHLHKRTGLQYIIALLIGFGFGFLLQKGGVTRHAVITNQLLLRDWTVVKVMLTAVAVGMIGLHLMRRLGWIQFSPKSGSIGASLIGGLIFGAGFALLGYCPGTMVGAVGQGNLDALFGGVAGMLLGTWVFARIYPRLKDGILKKGDFGDVTLPQRTRLPAPAVVVAALAIIAAVLWSIEHFA